MKNGRIQLAIPKPDWVCLNGKGEVIGRGHTLNVLLRDTTIPGDDSLCCISAPNGIKFSPETLVKMGERKLI